MCDSAWGKIPIVLSKPLELLYVNVNEFKKAQSVSSTVGISTYSVDDDDDRREKFLSWDLLDVQHEGRMLNKSKKKKNQKNAQEEENDDYDDQHQSQWQALMSISQSINLQPEVASRKQRL